MENKKSLIALALVALVGIIGATFAYFTSSATLTNEFTTGTYSTSVTEEFVSPSNWTPGTTTTKKVNVTNNGSVDVAVRATYTEKWTAKDGTILSGIRNNAKVAQFTIGSDWELAEDGYYYYNDTLIANETSSDFISSVTFNPNFILEEGTDIECTTTKENGKTTVNCANLESGYAGATYSLEITIETIQADQKWTYSKLRTYLPGEEITIYNEKFNVISDNGETITMLAQLNLDSNYKQSATANYISFADEKTWQSGKDINVNLTKGNVNTYLSGYNLYLQSQTKRNDIFVSLLNSNDLAKIGCSLEDYTCAESDYLDWIINEQHSWTEVAATSGNVWYISVSGDLYSQNYDRTHGIRPVVTISKLALID